MATKTSNGTAPPADAKAAKVAIDTPAKVLADPPPVAPAIAPAPAPAEQRFTYTDRDIAPEARAEVALTLALDNALAEIARLTASAGPPVTAAPVLTQRQRAAQAEKRTSKRVAPEPELAKDREWHLRKYEGRVIGKIGITVEVHDSTAVEFVTYVGAGRPQKIPMGALYALIESGDIEDACLID